MNEKQLRKKVVELLEPIGAFPVENILCPGMPDVVTVMGWLELKVAERPARAQTPISADLRPAQRVWLRRWRLHGGRAWTLTLVESTWFLHDAFWSADFLGTTTEDQMTKSACGCWPRTPTFEQLAQALMKIQAVN